MENKEVQLEPILNKKTTSIREIETQYENSLSDLNTIVLIANASLYNFRIELPIYTDSEDIEIATIDDFWNCLKALGLKKFTEEAKFKSLIDTLKLYGLMYDGTNYINVANLI